jgi:hypothetical protein
MVSEVALCRNKCKVDIKCEKVVAAVSLVSKSNVTPLRSKVRKESQGIEVTFLRCKEILRRLNCLPILWS